MKNLTELKIIATQLSASAREAAEWYIECLDCAERDVHTGRVSSHASNYDHASNAATKAALATKLAADAWLNCDGASK